MQEINKTEALASLQKAMGKNISYVTGETYKADLDQDIIYVMQGDGDYEVRNTDLATFVFRLSEHKIPGLPSPLKQGAVMKVPKLPSKIFYQLWNFFKKIHDEIRAEVYVRVMYDKHAKEFYFYVPDQEVSGGHASWEIDKPNEGKRNPDDILTMQVHSHHTMGGHFSTIDDADHKTLDGIHMVIGDIFKPFPTYELRYTLMERKINVDINHIFDMSNEKDFDISVFGDYKSKVRTFSSRTPVSRSDSIGQVSKQEIDLMNSMVKYDKQANLFDTPKRGRGRPPGSTKNKVNNVYKEEPKYEPVPQDRWWEDIEPVYDGFRAGMQRA